IEHSAEAGNGLSRHHGWNPNRWNLAHVDAMKRRLSDPDNRHRMLVHHDLSAHDVLRARELVFPEVVREHNGRTRSWRLVILGRQEPAHRGAHSQDRKVCTRYQFRGSQTRFSTRREVDGCGSTAEYAVEKFPLLLKILAYRIGHQVDTTEGLRQ